MKKYKHSLANYPTSFSGIVISKHKMCLQFQDVTTKLRVAYRDESDLIKLPTTERALPIVTKGSLIKVLAVGCPIEVIEDLQNDLIEAYADYYEKHNDYYKENYGWNFKNTLNGFLKKIHKIIED